MATITAIETIFDRQQDNIHPVLFRTGGKLRRIRFFPVHITPSTEHPVGQRGLAMARAWETLGKGKADGMLCKDADVAIDPVHVGLMFDAIDSDPGRVWTAPVRIWPVSNGRSDWVWAHWEEKASQNLDEYPQWFSFSFTYLPSSLIEASIRLGLVKQKYPGVDAFMSKVAQRQSIKAQAILDCFPVHLHW